MIDTDHYVRTLRYDRKSLAPPTLNCWGLWLYAVEREAGREALEGLEVYPSESTLLSQFRRLQRASEDASWTRVPPGGEQDLDLALMRALIGRGRTTRLVDLHCGVVVRPGVVMDIDGASGVLVRCFRTVGGERPHPTMWSRIENIYRWRGLC